MDMFKKFWNNTYQCYFNPVCLMFLLFLENGDICRVLMISSFSSLD